ncbi:MAG: hypothetical protein JST39_19945, partial [Bacteroidetes bacterium]|nr:hypothetical protein [Bacteroidota bacterium]
SEIDLAQKLNEKLSQFEELTKGKQLAVQKDLPPTLPLSIHPLLADILLNNLLSNAVKYTPPGGTLTLRGRSGLLEVGNTAEGKALDTQQLFRRFGKPGDNIDGVGLGLAIVKQISDFNDVAVQYHYKDDRHVFAFSWKNNEKV